MIDLHTHSIFSDGTCSIDQIIEKAHNLGLSQIAITDHNILKGSLYAHILDPMCLPGVELSVDYNNVEVHLLGYFPNGSDDNYKNVQFIIKESETNKKIAVMEMVENLNNMGYHITLQEVSKHSRGFVNRVHICKALMEHNYISSVQEGFEKLVGDHCEAFVERKVTPLFDAINAVHLDGGIAIIAHPYEYDELAPIDFFLNNIIGMIDGIECFHPSATKEQAQHLVEIATRNNKLITGGSDFHGDNKPDISLGMMNVDDIYKINRR